VQAVITGAATTIDTEDLTTSRALVSDRSGKVAVSDVTATELGYVDGVTSAIQTQLNAKVDEVSSTDNAIVRFNGTGGAVQNSGVTVDDSNNIITPSIYWNLLNRVAAYTCRNFCATRRLTLHGNDPTQHSVRMP